MLVYVVIGTCFNTKNYYSLPWQGEACTDKIYAGKTPGSVSRRRVRLRAVVITFRLSTYLIF